MTRFSQLPSHCGCGAEMMGSMAFPLWTIKGEPAGWERYWYCSTLRPWQNMFYSWLRLSGRGRGHHLFKAPAGHTDWGLLR